VELVTALLNKYRYDPFFRTETHIVALQAAYALIILSLVAISFSLLYHDVSRAILDGISAGLSGDNPASLGSTIVGQIQQSKAHNLTIITSVIVATAAVFGYIAARVTLLPTRNALHAQKQFIGNIAHELRTPLSVIKTNTEVALLDQGVPSDMRATLNSNVEELDRISETIDNLLSLSALIKPEQIDFASVDLSAITSDVLGKLSTLAKSSGHQVTIRKSPETMVWGNVTALQQVVGNLIKNALNYTPRGGHIRVTVDFAPNNLVELVVQDSGIGIARKDLFRIFEPFYRADSSRTKSSRGGNGLGLAIVSELVKMHHGKITIRSAVGRGTTVTVTLPASHGQVLVGNEVEIKEGLNEIAVDFSKR
jgi:signal transduction histidine kinase